MNGLKVGDEVRLKADGSTRMIVWKIEQIGVLCEWIDTSKTLLARVFSPAELEKVGGRARSRRSR